MQQLEKAAIRDAL